MPLSATEDTVGLAVAIELEGFRFLQVPFDATLAAKDTQSQATPITGRDPAAAYDADAKAPRKSWEGTLEH